MKFCNKNYLLFFIFAFFLSINLIRADCPPLKNGTLNHILEKVRCHHKKCCRVGPQGPQGPQGSQGPQGPSACSIPFTESRIVYVNKAGDDLTGDGSQCEPFLTIGKALMSITDASPTNRYEINIGPGIYVEPAIHIKANVQLVGVSSLLTQINSQVSIADPTWTGAGDNRAGCVNLSLLQGFSADFAVLSSQEGKLFFENIDFGSSVNFTAFSDLNQVIIQNSLLRQGYTQRGIDMTLFGSFISGGDIRIFTKPNASTRVHLVGGGITGDTNNSSNILVGSVLGDAPITSFELISFGIAGVNNGTSGNLSVTNNNTGFPIVIEATVDSIPIRSKVLSFGTVPTTLRRLNDANGLAYSPGNPGDWTVQPTTVQEALDRIAAFVGPI